MKCTICGYLSFKKQKYFFGFSINSKHINICKNCNLGFVKYDSNLIKSYYHMQESKKINYEFELSELSSVKLVHMFLKIAQKFTIVNNILDIGCGNGHFLFSAKQNNIYYLGVEPSKVKNDNAKKLGLNNILNIDLEQFIDDDNYKKKFDLIFLNNVLEHLEEPVLKIKKLKYMLNKNGLIIISVPNCNDAYYKYREHDHAPHLTFWNINSFKKLSNKLNFEILESGSFGQILRRNIILRLKNNLKHFFGWVVKEHFSILYKYLKKIKSKKNLNSQPEIINWSKKEFINQYNIHQVTNNNYNFEQLYICLKNIEQN